MIYVRLRGTFGKQSMALISTGLAKDFPLEKRCTENITSTVFNGDGMPIGIAEVVKAEENQIPKIKEIIDLCAKKKGINYEIFIN